MYSAEGARVEQFRESDSGRIFLGKLTSPHHQHIYEALNPRGDCDFPQRWSVNGQLYARAAYSHSVREINKGSERKKGGKRPCVLLRCRNWFVLQ